MLLLDDDDSLPVEPQAEEAALATVTGSDGIRRIDAAILRCTRASWLKVARVVHDAISAQDLDLSDATVALHTRRTIQLVSEGVLEGNGDLRKPRWSEVRLPTMLGKMDHEPKDGGEPFRDGSQSLGFAIRDFWRWAASDLVSNAMRGRLAEFLVARAAGVAGGIRNEWDSYDLERPSGVRIEVKSAAYLQTWGQQAESSISFGIGATVGWDPDTGKFETADNRRRQADIYVFALLAHRDKRSLDPMDVSQWEFRLMRADELDEHCSGQKRLSLGSLDKLNPVRCSYGGLADELRRLEEKCRRAAG